MTDGKAVFRYHWRDGHTVKETAERFGISKTMVRRICRRVKGESCGRYKKEEAW